MNAKPVAAVQTDETAAVGPSILDMSDADIPATVRKTTEPNPFTGLAALAAAAHKAGEKGGKRFKVKLAATDDAAQDDEIKRYVRLIGAAGRDAGISLNRRVDNLDRKAQLVTFVTWPGDKRTRVVKKDDAPTADAPAAV